MKLATCHHQLRKDFFWWRDILKLLDKSKGLAKPNINNARSCCLWLDLWNSNVPMHSYPELFSFARSKTTILAEAKSRDSILSLFHLPLSQQAFDQLNQLRSDLQQINLNEEADHWSCIWNTGKFSVPKAYKHLKGHRTIHHSYNWIWKCSCQYKHKVFAWLILKDRISTRELLRRKNMELQDYNCVLCSLSTEESLFHLLADCPFATACWNSIGLQVNHHLDLFQNLENFIR